MTDHAAIPFTENAPLPDKTKVGIDAIHAQIIDRAPWPLAQPVLTAINGPADLVLIAVPAGVGAQLASFLAGQLHIVEVTS